MFPEVPVEAVVARVTALGDGYHRAVATDADGTLWATDVADELFALLGERRDFRGAARDALRRRAASYLDDVPDDDHALAQALLRANAAGRITVAPMCELQAEATGERSEAELAALYAEVAERVAPTVRVGVRDLILQLRAVGWRVHVASGSLGDAVAVCMRRVGIPFDTVDGAALRRRGDHVEAALDGEIPLFDGKVRAFTRQGVWPAAVGLGDGGWDVTFLRDAGLPVLVHPKPALSEAMAGHPRAVVLV
jgi:phosphoserine phosphatase